MLHCKEILYNTKLCSTYTSNIGELTPAVSMASKSAIRDYVISKSSAGEIGGGVQVGGREEEEGGKERRKGRRRREG